MTDLTPMMKQYLEIKKKNPDAILFFRLGDFYEMFGDDAKIASKILQIALTARSAGEKRQIKMPMCGVPYHAANSYILKLIKNGYKVAICEQIEDPKLAKGIVKREIVKIITPGTVLDESALDKKTNNYLLSLFIEKKFFSFSFVDISTGEFFVGEIENKGNFDRLIDEIEKIQPTEILLPLSYEENDLINKNFLLRLKKSEKKIFFNFYDDLYFQYDIAYNKLKEHFNVENLAGFGIEEKKGIIASSGALLNYLYDTQKTVLFHINRILKYTIDNVLYLDAVSLKNLELIDSDIKSGEFSTLFDVLDFTQTSMGSRELKKWIKSPLLDKNEIIKRQNLIQFFIDFPEVREDIKNILKDISDIERISGRIGSSSINARDLISLKKAIFDAKKLQDIIEKDGSTLLKEKFKFFNEKLSYIYNLIDKSIVDEPPLTIKDGGIIKPEYNEELKKLKDISKKGKEWIATLQEKERKRTNIQSLKVGYNSVFGYYIEVSKANLKNVPPDYIRKQTLVNSERFITPELKEYESAILGAEDKIKDLEYKIFIEIKNELIKYISTIQTLAKNIAYLDVIISLSIAAITNNYTKPTILDTPVINIKEGRHPVIEKSLGYNEFVPNDTYLDSDNFVMLITGPNMAGKSTYMRQVALIVILAQMGSFVPAKSAEIGIVDKIFTRIGASDYLARGQSTFMVEMIETANILNNATEKSLILLDEIGRGTSTFDGISIAWAVTEYIHDYIKAKTLFATHYYELTEIAELLKGVNNYNIQVKEWGDKIIFLRKIVKGSTDRSYGIHVAQLAGLPDVIIERAKVILKELENANYTKDGKPKIGKQPHNVEQINLFSLLNNNEEIIDELKNIDINTLSPVDALLKLKELKDKIK